MQRWLGSNQRSKSTVSPTTRERSGRLTDSFQSTIIFTFYLSQLPYPAYARHTLRVFPWQIFGKLRHSETLRYLEKINRILHLSHFLIKANCRDDEHSYSRHAGKCQSCVSAIWRWLCPNCDSIAPEPSIFSPGFKLDNIDRSVRHQK